MEGSSADRAVWLGGWWLAEAVSEVEAGCSVVEVAVKAGCMTAEAGEAGCTAVEVAEEVEAGLTNNTEASLSMRLLTSVCSRGVTDVEEAGSESCMDTEAEADN